MCASFNILGTVGLNSREASGKHVKRSEKVLKTSSEKYLLAIRRRPLKLFWFCHCWYFLMQIVLKNIYSVKYKTEIKQSIFDFYHFSTPWLEFRE